MATHKLQVAGGQSIALKWPFSFGQIMEQVSDYSFWLPLASATDNLTLEASNEVETTNSPEKVIEQDRILELSTSSQPVESRNVHHPPRSKKHSKTGKANVRSLKFEAP